MTLMSRIVLGLTYLNQAGRQHGSPMFVSIELYYVLVSRMCSFAPDTLKSFDKFDKKKVKIIDHCINACMHA